MASNSPSSSENGPAGLRSQAAVALVRTLAADPEYLVLRRATNPEDPWSGHFALPGGRWERSDRDLLYTCIRETEEECGFQLDPGQLVRTLPLAIAGGHMGTPMAVAPFLFEVPGKPPLSLAAREIAEFHWLPESYLRDPANRRNAAMSLAHPDRQFPCIRVGAGEGAIWGFTYGVLESLWESALP